MASDLGDVTVHLLVDGLYYVGVFSSREKAMKASERWREYTGRKPQIATMLLDESALDKYEER